MTYPVFSYRDTKVGFGQPIIENNDQSAVRGFSYAMNNKDGMMFFSPADFDLYKIGTFDTDKGLLVGEKVPVLIVNGSSVVGDKE